MTTATYAAYEHGDPSVLTEAKIQAAPGEGAGRGAAVRHAERQAGLS